MEIREEYNKKMHNEVFYFLSGFLISPFLFFIAKTSIIILKDPTKLNEAIVILYLALLTGVYYIIQAKEGFPYFSKEKNKSPDRYLMLVGFAVFWA